MVDYSGSILELNRDRAIVMTDTCDFVTLKRQPGMAVGQQVSFRESDFYRAPKSHIKYAALAASVLMIVFSFLLYDTFFTPSAIFAYIDVDINPSVEFAVDKSARVVDIKPLNEDARALLGSLQLKGLPVRQAIDGVVKESKQQGFIKADGKHDILISASIQSSSRHKPNQAEEKALDTLLNDIHRTEIDLGSIKIRPEVVKVTPEGRNQAVDNGISMGRYALFEKLSQKNGNMTIEEARTARVSDMLDGTRVKDTGTGEAEENGREVQTGQIEEDDAKNQQPSDDTDKAVMNGDNPTSREDSWVEEKVEKGKTQEKKGNNAVAPSRNTAGDQNSSVSRDHPAGQTNKADGNANPNTGKGKNTGHGMAAGPPQDKPKDNPNRGNGQNKEDSMMQNSREDSEAEPGSRNPGSPSDVPGTDPRPGNQGKPGKAN